ncbi:hypothetical protein LTR95_010789 [Oleoguttula sp. CCFEE 5521]
MADLLGVIDSGLIVKVRRLTPKWALMGAILLNEAQAKAANLPSIKEVQSTGKSKDPVAAAVQCETFYAFMSVWMYLHHASRPNEAVIFTRLFAQLLGVDSAELMDMMMSTVHALRRDISYEAFKDFDAFVANLECGKQLKRSQCILLAASALIDVATDLADTGHAVLAETWRLFAESMQLYADEFRDREYAEIRRKDKLEAQRKLNMEAFDDFGPKWMERWLLEGLDEPPSPPDTVPPPTPNTPNPRTGRPPGMCAARWRAWQLQRPRRYANPGPPDPMFREAMAQFAKEYPEAWEMALQPNPQNEKVFTDAVVKFAKENPKAFGPQGAELLELYYSGKYLGQQGT